MPPTASRKIFVNLAVHDLPRSMDFFALSRLLVQPAVHRRQGGLHGPQRRRLRDAPRRPFFETFTRNKMCETATHTEALLALSCDSRDEVDKMVRTAIEAGGSHAMEPQDQGFMYGWSFYDLDGHHWEVFWMDPATVQK